MDTQKIVKTVKYSKFTRFVFYPLVRLREFLLFRKYQKTEDSEYVKSLCDKYKDRRCFVIGNGPSLNTEDLEKIRGEISFASNRIYHIFPRTDWRPDYYLTTDPDAILPEYENILSGGDYPKFINYKVAGRLRKRDENLWYVYLRGVFRVDPAAPMAERLSEDASKYLTKSHTVTANAIEMAVYMGFSEIYLLGVDHDYARKKDKNGRIYDDPSVKSSYFEGMKTFGNKGGAETSSQNVEGMNYSYALCKKLAEEKGVKIYNATRGGKLEIFERADFDGLFESMCS